MPKASNAATKVQTLPSVVYDKRITGVYYFSAIYSNPQGDPDRENQCRLDHNSFGIVTAQGIKRKIRNVWAMQGHNIHVSKGADLSAGIIEAASKLGIDLNNKKTKLSSKDKAAIVEASAAIYKDIRAFGGVMTTINEGVTGPVQFTPAISVNPVNPLEWSTTRIAVASAKEAETKDRTMGRQNVVPYGLYRGEFTISAYEANNTKFTHQDVEDLLLAMTRMFDLTKSSGRSNIVLEKLYVFEHTDALGNVADHKLLKTIKVTPSSETPKSFEDYSVYVDEEEFKELSKGNVTLREVV